jgi:predicted transcriptional regulator
LPFSDIELENFLLKIGRPARFARRLDSPEARAAKNLGGGLFKAVFDDEVLRCFRSSLEIAEQQHCGLRLRLRFSEAPELADLPWEFLYDPAVDRFLSHSIETPVVRYLELPERIRPLSVEPPLRVMVMIASPEDYPELEVEREWEKLNEALFDLQHNGLVVLERLEKATLPILQRRLRQEEYHIFHFIGHGGFDHQAHDGVLIIEDERRQPYMISGKHLGTLLHDERTLRLALLNACEGARNSRTDPFAGTAQSLVQQGIPAVIAMQFEVTDAAAIKLAHEFYAAFSDGYPVDAALAEARKALYTQGNEIEWGTPVLHMRSPDGRIFHISPAAAVKTKNKLTGSKLPKKSDPILDEILIPLYRQQICLSILFYLNELPPAHEDLNITAIVRALGIKKRRYAHDALKQLANDGLIEKFSNGKNVSWKISDRGRRVQQKLGEWIETRVAKVTRSL